MKRGKGLVRKTGLNPGKGLTRGAGLNRGKPLRYRSKKTTALYARRRELVAALLEDGVCERCKAARATDVHEPLLRSRGGDITDPDQCVALCRSCHDFVHNFPLIALEEGFMKHSWGQVGGDHA